MEDILSAIIRVKSKLALMVPGDILNAEDVTEIEHDLNKIEQRAIDLQDEGVGE